MAHLVGTCLHVSASQVEFTGRRRHRRFANIVISGAFVFCFPCLPGGVRLCGVRSRPEVRADSIFKIYEKNKMSDYGEDIHKSTLSHLGYRGRCEGVRGM